MILARLGTGKVRYNILFREWIIRRSAAIDRPSKSVCLIESTNNIGVHDEVMALPTRDKNEKYKCHLLQYVQGTFLLHFWFVCVLTMNPWAR